MARYHLSIWLLTRSNECPYDIYDHNRTVLNCGPSFHISNQTHTHALHGSPLHRMDITECDMCSVQICRSEIGVELVQTRSVYIQFESDDHNVFLLPSNHQHSQQNTQENDADQP